MRKRAQSRSLQPSEDPKYKASQPKIIPEKKQIRIKKNYWLPIILVCIVSLVLFMNTYYNLTTEISYDPDGEGIESYLLSGPDPYYNMRLIEITHETGKYPYYSEVDPLLNYPLGASGGRPPLFNMMALGFSRLLTPFMDEIDAIGISMQFIPALFGALIVFVVYFIGKEMFNKKAGIIAAMLMAIIPIHLGSGHGSAFSLFDHDSFNLLLFFITFFFLIKALKDSYPLKSTLYAILGGISLAALSMVWVESQYLFVVISIYALLQMIFDIYTNKIEFRVFRTTSIILVIGWLISLPVLASRGGIRFNTQMFLTVAVVGFGFVYYFFRWKKIPWTISLPTIFSIGAVSLVFLYFIEPISASIKFLTPLKKLSTVIFGSGIYGNKVSMTIAEANTAQISQTVMSFGPAIYWLGWGGFILLLWHYYKNNKQRDYLFFLTLFVLNIYLAGIAGRFLNDMVPIIAILGGWLIWFLIDWIDYKQMIRNIRSAGGGFHGLRRGIKFLHIFGILFIAFIVVLPNAFISFDAAVPNALTKNQTSILKVDMFGDEHRGAFGLGIGKERYWSAAFRWLDDQDIEIEDESKRPAFISWWDYGFYEVALGGHPTVADNFQDGIPPAANFHTSTTEQEAIAVWITRLLEGNQHNNNYELTQEVKDVLRRYLGKNNSEKIEQWTLNPTSSPSYGEPIGEEYDINTSKDYTVGQQYEYNAVYHDVVNLLTNDTIDPLTNETIGLSDDELTWLYHDLQEATGYSIRYYGVEGYDKQIFNIFGFLSDKSTLLVSGIADDYIELYYEGYELDTEGKKKPGSEQEWTAEEILGMDYDQRRFIQITGTQQSFKDLYFDTMFYKTYVGPAKGESPNKEEFDWQVPCVYMKHFYAEYISDITKYPYYGSSKGSVVIAKYYEGAYVNGTIRFLGEPIEAEAAVIKNLTFYENVSFGIDHDSAFTNSDGNFSVIAGAGAYLQLRKSLGEGTFILDNITFEGDDDFSPITDNDASRKDGSNFERYLNISIEPGYVEGVIYDDINNDSMYNSSVDIPLENADITIYEITEFTQDGATTLSRAQLVTDETGFYNFSDLMPGYYFVRVVKDDLLIIETMITIQQGNNFEDLAKMKPGSIEGTIVYNDFGNEVEIENADIDLTYIRYDISGGVVEEYIPIISTKTDNDGYYKVDKILNPGVYLLNVTSSEHPNPYYTTSEEIRIEENETKIQNITIQLTPVEVSGITRYQGTPVDGLKVTFAPDGSENNTAQLTSYTSDENGFYSIAVRPGKYEVEVTKSEGDPGSETLVYWYQTSEEFDIGQGVAKLDFSVEKNSTTVKGTVTYTGNGIEGIEISFIPTEKVNNTAISANTISIENGEYTVELNPGEYNINISFDFTENAQNYTYHYDEILDEITTVGLIITKDIPMAREERD
jgi:dolichyl-diphosphooligosaccharide--protein glycosyltransferase